MVILSINNTADIYGASRCLERVFGSFAEAGETVHVVVPEHGPLIGLLEARGIEVHVHKGLATIDRKQLSTLTGMFRFALLFPYSVVWLMFLIIKLRVDVVHTNTVVMPTPALAAFLARRKHVWHVRELLAEFGPLWKPYQRYVYYLSTVVVAISQCVRDQFDRGLLDRVHVIYDGVGESNAAVDLDRKEAFRKQFPDATMLVGVVGRIKWKRKGQEILVHAAALLSDKYSSVKYLIIGSASPGNESHVARLLELISEHKLENVVRLTGEMQDITSVIAGLDILVVPSVQPEPFGCVVMEAMIVGTPVIGSRCGGIAEQIRDTATGLLFAPGDAEALARSVDTLLADKDLRVRMSREAHRYVLSNLSLESTYQKMIALFHSVAITGG